MERTLREGGERADRLDLVAEELDADRLAAGRGEDVDDAAADGELAAVVDALDACVPGERERLGERLDADLGAGAELDLDGTRGGRRHRLGERARGRADEAAPREHVERPRALAGEVRRRLEARVPAHAAARQVADDVVAEEPGGRLGRVPRVRVLGEEADEPAAELLVQRREHERQRRLGHADARRHRVGELAEALVVDELLDEGVEYRTVHDDRRNPRFRRGHGSCTSMCRNIHTLYNFDPPATEHEVRGAAEQYVRKVSGFTKPSRANEAAFARAVDEVAEVTRRLLDELVTTAPSRNREVEAERARARAAKRFATA